MDFITLGNKDKNKLIEDIIMYPLKMNKDVSGVLREEFSKYSSSASTQ